jgi:hypothetical protein
MQFRGRTETLVPAALGGTKLTGYAEAKTTVREVIRDSAPGQSPVASQSRPGSAHSIIQGVFPDIGAADAGLRGGTTRVVVAGESSAGPPDS